MCQSFENKLRSVLLQISESDINRRQFMQQTGGTIAAASGNLPNAATTALGAGAITNSLGTGAITNSLGINYDELLKHPEQWISAFKKCNMVEAHSFKGLHRCGFGGVFYDEARKNGYFRQYTDAILATLAQGPMTEEQFNAWAGLTNNI